MRFPQVPSPCYAAPGKAQAHPGAEALLLLLPLLWVLTVLNPLQSCLQQCQESRHAWLMWPLWEGQPSRLLPPTLPAWELLRLVLQGAGILCASEAGSHNAQEKGGCASQQVKFTYPVPGQASPRVPAKELGKGSSLQLRNRRRNALWIWLVFESQNWQG